MRRWRCERKVNIKACLFPSKLAGCRSREISRGQEVQNTREGWSFLVSGPCSLAPLDLFVGQCFKEKETKEKETRYT